MHNKIMHKTNVAGKLILSSIPSDSTRWLADTAPDLLCNLQESLTNTNTADRAML